jgi:hypothetical protein
VVNSVIFDNGVAEALPRGAAWAQMGTIGTGQDTAHCAQACGEYGAALPVQQAGLSRCPIAIVVNVYGCVPGEVVRGGFLYHSQLGHGQIVEESPCYGRAGS